MKKSKLVILFFLFLSLCFAALASFRLFTNKSFSFHDETQIVNLFEYAKVIDLGQFPPRWSPDMHFNYGSPYPEFNYQLPYYLGVGFHKLGYSFIDSYKLVLGLSFIIGSIGAYFLALKFLSPFMSFLSAVFFTFIPYRAVDVYVRGTIGEALAISILPFVVLSLYYLYENPKIKNVLLVSLSVAALIITHQPTTVLCLPIILIVYVLLCFFQNRHTLSILGLFVSLGFAALLIAYYIFPLLAEKQFIQEVLPFNFYDHFPFLKQLVYSPWGYGSSNWGPYDDLSFSLGFAPIVTIILSFITFFLPSKEKRFKVPLALSLFGFGLAIFFMNIRSSFFWNVFPYTNAIQFPWRLLTATSLFSLLIFIFFNRVLPSRASQAISVALIALCLLTEINHFQPGTLTQNGDSYYLRRYLPNIVLYPGENVSKEYLDYTENYLPLPSTATRPSSMPSAKVTSANIKTSIRTVSDNPLNYEAEVTVSTLPRNNSADVVTFHTFDYPGWQASLDYQPSSIVPSSSGAITIAVPKGTHRLAFSYQNTPIRYISNIISLVSGLFLLVYFVFYAIRNRKSVFRKRN